MVEMVPNERASPFVTVPCPCGRSLRAKLDQVGTEVRCWDCHQMVMVPFPNQGQRVARELSDGALVVIKGPGLNSVILGAVVVTALMVIPTYGVWFSMIALVMGASIYGEIIRRVSRGPTEEPGPGLFRSLLPRSILKFLFCGLMAAGTTVPLWILHAGPHRSPRWDPIGRGVATIAWLVLPFLMMILYSRTEEDGPPGWTRSLKLMLKHPFAMFLAIAVVPLTLLLVEVGLSLVLFFSGNLAYFALDYMPMPLMPPAHEAPVMYNGIPHYHMVDYRTYPPHIFHEGYRDGLRQGYSLVGAIPASMSMGTRGRMDAGEGIGLPEPFYGIVRILITLTIVTCLLAAFAIQAQWMGSIPALERQRKPSFASPGLASSSPADHHP